MTTRFPSPKLEVKKEDKKTTMMATTSRIAERTVLVFNAPVEIHGSVKLLMEQCGRIDCWSMKRAVDSGKMYIRILFSTVEEAVRAVDNLNQLRVSEPADPSRRWTINVQRRLGQRHSGTASEVKHGSLESKKTHPGT